jgi:hypothetical protein
LKAAFRFILLDRLAMLQFIFAAGHPTRFVKDRRFVSHRVFSRVCVLSLLLLAISVLATSGAQTGTLRGVVRDPTGAVLPGAAVLIQHWRVIATNRSLLAVEPIVYADSGGKFVARLAPDLYDVTVSYPAFSPIAKKVEVKLGKDTRMDCELPASPLVKSVE